MKPSDLLRQASIYGIRAEVSGERLILRRRKGTQPPAALCAEMESRAPEIAAYLAGDVADVAPDTDATAPADVTHERCYTPTPSRRVWVRSRLPGLEGKTILCVETEADIPPGHEGPAFTRDELRRMVDLDAAAVLAVYESKSAFGGRYTGLTPPTDITTRFYPPPAESEAGAMTLAMFKEKEIDTRRK